jgi:hypothetical protein
MVARMALPWVGLTAAKMVVSLAVMKAADLVVSLVDLWVGVLAAQ